MFALGQEITDILLSHSILFRRTIVNHSMITIEIPFKTGLRDKLCDIFCDYNHKIHFCNETNQYLLKVKDEYLPTNS
jgi:hypothetical protein